MGIALLCPSSGLSRRPDPRAVRQARCGPGRPGRWQAGSYGAAGCGAGHRCALSSARGLPLGLCIPMPSVELREQRQQRCAFVRIELIEIQPAQALLWQQAAQALLRRHPLDNGTPLLEGEVGDDLAVGLVDEFFESRLTLIEGTSVSTRPRSTCCDTRRWKAVGVLKCNGSGL